MTAPLPSPAQPPRTVSAEGLRAWVVAAEMGYGHRRAVEPFREVAEREIIVVGDHPSTPEVERRLWSRLLRVYESFSRARALPVAGKPIFTLLDRFLHIPSFYPMRDLSNATFQVDLLERLIRQGLCRGVLSTIAERRLPLLTSFYAPAIAADLAGYDSVYCIICDADLNRVWVAKQPWESRVHYFTPCGKASQRLRAYGVAEERIFTTGFPLPHELLGGPDLPVLKADLLARLARLDPRGKFLALYGSTVRHFLGALPDAEGRTDPLTIMFAVGGAGAQREIGVRLAASLRHRIRGGEVRLVLAAGTREEVRASFDEVRRSVGAKPEAVRVLWAPTIPEYFSLFNAALRSTDILWTKPSELSFFCALGIPIIMTPTIGAQEKFNRAWLTEIQAGIRQENPEYTDQWLFDWIADGRLAEAAWEGFLKARKQGTYRILEVLKTGGMTRHDSPLHR